MLIGGANLPDNIVTYLRSFSNNIFQTFGMTETVSHIALKKLSGKKTSDTYEVLKGIEIGKDNRGCLTVNGVITGGKKLITNDLVELIDDKRFLWKGRIDQVINTGGVKINVIDLEKKIGDIFKSKDISFNFFIASLPDFKLGERVILVVEAVESEFNLENIKSLCKNRLSKFEMPREIHVIRKFLFTESGKVNRPAILSQLSTK